MTNNNEEQKPKKASRFGSIDNQWNTLGGGKATNTTDIETSKRLEVKKLKSLSTGMSEEKKEQQTVYLPKSLQKWLRVRAPLEERDISDVVIQALEEYRTKVEAED